MSSANAPLAQVIVVGGGPAGSSLAYGLASAGISVAVFEKSTFPRYKTCGGGVQARTARLLDFSIEPVVERVITRMRVTANMRDAFTKADNPLVYTVMRDRFDSFLAEKAKDRGALFFEDERVTALQEGPHDVLVQTSKRQTRAAIVVGADGAGSIVRRKLYPGLRLQNDLGVQAEVAVPIECLDDLRDTIVVDGGTLPGGYAWAFPKDKHMSIGAGGPLQIRDQIRRYYRDFLRMLEEQGIIRDYSVGRLSSHLLPTPMGENQLNTSRTLVVWDAAGLIDPFTGEGIYYAVRSGQIAASVIIRCSACEAPDLSPYTMEIASSVVSELERARALMYLFNTWPRGFHAWLRRSDGLCRAMARTLSGEKGYAGWREELGRAQFLWPVIDSVTSGIANRKLTRVTAGGGLSRARAGQAG
jgi:geranylgeranyl reductase family protein